MGYAGKLKEKRAAIKLREQGLSYSQIKEKVKVSKGTLSRWCRNIILSPSQLEKLRKRKITGSERGRLIGAKVNQKRRIKQEKDLMGRGIKEVGKVNKRDRFIAGIALYMADGSKAGSSVEFTNSDPKMIKFMTNWFREFCQVDTKQLRGSLWIHDNLNVKKAKFFWGKITGIHQDQFHKSYITKNKKNSNKIRKIRHKYGIFKIRFFDVAKLRLIKGWIEGVLTNG